MQKIELAKRKIGAQNLACDKWFNLVKCYTRKKIYVNQS